jgi:simple sugar transport system permease protein
VTGAPDATAAAAVLAAGVRIAVPLVFLVIGELIAERAGVLNVGLEGLLLAGAFGAFAGALLSGSPLVGLGVAILASVALAALLALCVVRLGLDQIVTGVALNILSLGLTGVFFRALAEGRASLAVPTFAPAPIRGLASLPLIGVPLFAQSPFAYATYPLVAAAAIFLYRTRAGLIVRATGESPHAVDALGAPVALIRCACVLACGALAGVAGAYLSISYANTFVEGMSDGRGFVALALVVFARWDPWRAAAGALLFGCATALGIRLQGEDVGGVEVPYQLFQALPYLLTLAVIAASGGRGAAAPAALGRFFRR